MNFSMTSLLLGALAGGAALFSAYVLWRDEYGSKARAFAKRIAAVGSASAIQANASILKTGVQGTALHQLLLNKVAWAIRYAGLSWSLRRFGLYVAIGALLCGGVGVVAGAPSAVAVVLFVVGASLPFFGIRILGARRALKLENQLPDVLDMMSSMLRSGHALPTALALLGDQAPAPIGEEFKMLHDEITYGGSTEDALNHMVERTRSEDVRCFVMAILIQRETGGNLTAVLDGLSGVVRERLKLRGKIRALSAEGRMSTWILTLLPLVVALALGVLEPEYLRVFWTDPSGIKMLYTMVVMLVLGNALMLKIARVRA